MLNHFFADIKDKKILVPLCLIIMSIIIAAPFFAARLILSDSSENSSKAKRKEVSDHYAPVFSADSGFYDDIFSLEITSREPGARIFFTVDGSVPTAASIPYEGPLMIGDRTPQPNYLSAIGGTSPFREYIPKDNITKATVIRAVALLPDGTYSSVSNRTYFVGVDREALYGSVPIISLFIDPSSLFDYETGIYVLGRTYDDWLAANNNGEDAEDWEIMGNFSNTGTDWERQGAVEFLPSTTAEDGDTGFSTDIGVRIMGGQSRMNIQKSFRLKCREEYGEKSIKYNIIPDNVRSDEGGYVKKYKSFVLRNGGNDCDYLKFRDSFIQDMVSDCSFDTQASMPVVLFIDGEYWGCYVLYEDYSDNYIENNYGIGDDKVVIVKNWKLESGEEADMDLFREMYNTIVSNDMSDPAEYREAASMLDMPGFAQFCALNIYIHNEDSVFRDNNWQLWRVRGPGNKNSWSDGKWRVLTFDTEFSTGIYSDGTDYDACMLDEALSEGDSFGCSLLSSLIKNGEFRNLFVNALCDMRNISFEKAKVDESLPEYRQVYGKLVPDTQRRFGPFEYEADTFFDEKADGLKTWLDGRYDVFPTLIQEQFGYTEPKDVCVRTSDGTKGGFSLNNGKHVFFTEYRGYYFKETGFTVRAESNIPAGFDHWEVKNGTISDPHSVTATVIPEEGCEVTAVYR